jgi:hypothetical protein
MVEAERNQTVGINEEQRNPKINPTKHKTKQKILTPQRNPKINPIKQLAKHNATSKICNMENI